MEYHIGDKLLCRISVSGRIVFNIDFYNPLYIKMPTKFFEVIGIHQNQYIILVSEIVDGSFQISSQECKEYNLHHKWYDTYAFLLKERAAGGRIRRDPVKEAIPCFICGNYISYAEPNQEDGRFICYSCRTDARYQLVFNLIKT